MKISLNIATYNAPEELRGLLQSVANQNRLPDETVVMEDGRFDTTVQVVDSFRTMIPNLKHLQQEDQGFRLARLRNLGLVHSTGSYIVSIDGDLILHPSFIEDHARVARKGYFVQGTRQKLSQALSARLLEESRGPAGLECLFGREAKNKSRLWALRSRVLSSCFSKDYTHARKISGCHQAFFREDVVRINGYENSYVGWGEEDQNLVKRLMLLGLKEYHLRYAAIAWHLYHPMQARVNERIATVDQIEAEDGIRELASELGMPL